MTNIDHRQDSRKQERPKFPKKAVITAGMPYGNKELHFGHIGGVFIYADVYTRFLKDRIGKENVIFVSGTDGYGSPIVESFQKVQKDGFSGDITDFVAKNHNSQKEVLKNYNIDISLFSASSFGRSNEVHQEICSGFLIKLHENGHLKKMTTKQFYDSDLGAFLNGRQVLGKCPIDNCPSDKAYADECSLGHQYLPSELKNPKSTLSDKAPEMKDVTNWFIDLANFRSHLNEWAAGLDNGTKSRKFYIKTISEFFEPPIIHVKRDEEETLNSIRDQLPPHEDQEGNTKAIRVVFQNLEDRETACQVMAQAGIRFRTGKTLVPFRLTGNIEWGLKIPDIEDMKDLTWWVWPESLIAPISFTASYLESKGGRLSDWKTWWCNPNTEIFQFIGEDNVYFYGIAEIAMFLGQQGKNLSQININPADGQLQLPQLVVNNHLLFLDKKASSSADIKPPMAKDLLDYYTSDQLRAHFFALGLGIKSVSFKPKPLDPNADEKAGDPVLKEGNLLSNVFNRALRSCFYTGQKYFEGKIPVGIVSPEALDMAQSAVLKFERSMHRQESHLAMSCLDKYIRDFSKIWTHKSKEADEKGDLELWRSLLIDTHHLVRVATVLLHPIAPDGCEIVCEYYKMDPEIFWSWENILKPLSELVPPNHQLKELEPRVDFFNKHPSQFNQG